MFSYGVSLGILAISIASVAASQLIVKWRLGQVVSPDAPPASRTQYILTALGDGWIWVGICLIGLSAALWYVAMSRLPLSFMMPVAAVVAPIVALSAHLFLKEPLGTGQIAAIAMIAVGVAWLGWQQ